MSTSGAANFISGSDPDDSSASADVAHLCMELSSSTYSALAALVALLVSIGYNCIGRLTLDFITSVNSVDHAGSRHSGWFVDRSG